MSKPVSMLECLEPRLMLSATVVDSDALADPAAWPVPEAAIVLPASADHALAPADDTNPPQAVMPETLFHITVQDTDGHALVADAAINQAPLTFEVDLETTTELTLRVEVGTDEDPVMEDGAVDVVIDITADGDVSYVAFPGSLSLIRPSGSDPATQSEPVNVDIEDEDGNDAGTPPPFQVLVLDREGRPAQGISVTVTYRADNNPIARFTVSVSNQAKFGDYTIQVRPQHRGDSVSRLLMPLWVDGSG
ncbi:MAG: hypothetical protein AAF797_02535 [Planctomycetota bacterium]